MTNQIDTRITISKERFLALNGYTLGQELINPAILQVRGQNLEKKRAVYETLTSGQNSLFAFWILYGHTQSGWLRFFWEGLYVGGYEQFLPMIKAGLAHSNAQKLLTNVIEAEEIYKTYQEYLQTVRSLEEPQGIVFEQMTQAFSQVDTRLFTLLGETMQIIEQYIRAKPDEFVLFTN